MGLSISKQLVEMMGGEIWCESRAGVGSIFSFTAWFGVDPAYDLRLRADDGAVGGGDKAQLFDFSGSRILLVEDDEINQYHQGLPDVLPTGDTSLPGALDATIVTPILVRLLGFINGRDGKAERYLDDYQKELAGLSDKEVRQIRANLNNFDFSAAGEALLSLAERNGIILTSQA